MFVIMLEESVSERLPCISSAEGYLVATKLKVLLIAPTVSETMWKSIAVEVQLNFGSSYVL